MQTSKFIRILCYILMPVFIALLIMSVFSIIVEDNIYFSEEKYFKSEEFVSSYMNYVSNTVSNLIYTYNQDTNRTILDGDTTIYYINNKNYYKWADSKILAIYKNKALTNVNITAETKSIEGIKNYINKNKESNKVKIINGNIEATSEVLQSKGMDNFNGRITYYKTENESYAVDEDTEMIYPLQEYKTTEPEEFEIYSSYLEEFPDDTLNTIVKNKLDKLPIIKENAYIIIPATGIGIILMVLHLIISIGHVKDGDEVQLNDFDKIPLEIIIIIATFISAMPFAPLEGIRENYDAILSMISTGLLIVYVSSAITLHTTIKRVKAKKLLRTTIIGKILLLIEKCFQKILKKTKEIYEDITYSTSATVRIVGYIGIMLVTSLLIFIIFNGEPFFIILAEFGLISFGMYKILKTVKDYLTIENKLKEMYEGNNQNQLEEENFIPEFKNTVKYINDISNGFENAIQDRMKSEKLKAELITNVSHDIKTPLTSIINYVDLLKKENIDNEKAKEYIDILENKSLRLKRLTEDLIEASKVSSGNVQLNLEKINIGELINQTTGEFEDRFKQRGLETIVKFPEEDVFIEADSRYMYRIIENLFSNIAKYASSNSRVYLDIFIKEGNVNICIKNISEEKLNISTDELMQRFVRGDKSRTTEGSGLRTFNNKKFNRTSKRKI